MSVASLLLLAMVLELAASAWGGFRRWSSARRPDGPLVIVRDSRLGWRSTPNRALQIALDSEAGPQPFHTDERGWRRDDFAAGSGDEQEYRRPFLLVIGDSYTHGQGIADGALFYDHIASHLGADVVALGVGGYGTLQELLVAKQEKARLPSPDLVLLQLCDNDFINNSYELERRSWLNNNLLPRPYLEQNEVVVRDPRRWFERLTLGRQITRRFLARRAKRKRDSVEYHLEEGEREAFRLYLQARSTTARALSELRALFPQASAIAFNVSGTQSRRGRDLARLSQEAGFRFYRLDDRLENQGDIFLDDGVHWNQRGHEIVGTALGHEMLKLIVPPSVPPP